MPTSSSSKRWSNTRAAHHPSAQGVESIGVSREKVHAQFSPRRPKAPEYAALQTLGGGRGVRPKSRSVLECGTTVPLLDGTPIESGMPGFSRDSPKAALSRRAPKPVGIPGAPVERDSVQECAVCPRFLLRRPTWAQKWNELSSEDSTPCPPAEGGQKRKAGLWGLPCGKSVRQPGLLAHPGDRGAARTGHAGQHETDRAYAGDHRRGLGNRSDGNRCVSTHLTILAT